jgi:FkbM family methyltransferase
MAGPKLLRAFAACYPEAFFVEIGANDGIQHDHLRSIILSSRWSGIMVEPVPYVFERLATNYAGVDRVIVEAAAVAGRDTKLPFYYLRPPADDERARLPDWYDGIGSFSRETILSHARDIPDVESRVVDVEVECLTFDSLLQRHESPRVDVVVIDTEGYDWEIIKHIDLVRHAPKLLVYEHFHLAAAERAACGRHVESQGYAVKEEGFDTFCLSHRVDERLQRFWARLEPAVAGVSKFDEPEA